MSSSKSAYQAIYCRPGHPECYIVDKPRRSRIEAEQDMPMGVVGVVVPSDKRPIPLPRASRLRQPLDERLERACGDANSREVMIAAAELLADAALDAFDYDLGAAMEAATASLWSFANRGKV